MQGPKDQVLQQAELQFAAEHVALAAELLLPLLRTLPSDAAVRVNLGLCRQRHCYRRTLINPARPKAPSADMITRIDEEAAQCLLNIRRAVETRVAARSTGLKP